MHRSTALNKLVFGCAIVMLLLSTFGCTEKPLAFQSFQIQDALWTYQDSLIFAFEIEEKVPSYNLNLNLTHADNYRFSNLYVEIKTLLPDGELKTQPVSLDLADPTGKWHGKCSGSKCKISIPLQINFKFDQVGKYEMTIHQFMRQSPIEGIDKLALTLIRAND